MKTAALCRRFCQRRKQMSKLSIAAKIGKWLYAHAGTNMTVQPPPEKVYLRPVNHLQILGLPVRDRVTKFKGTASSVVYDLYGCIQVSITPEIDKDGKAGEIRWYDVARLEVLGTKSIVPLPDYSKGYVAEGRKGPNESRPPMS